MSLHYFAGFYCNTQQQAEQNIFENKLKLAFFIIVGIEIAWWATGTYFLSSKSRGKKIGFHIFMSIILIVTAITCFGIGIKLSPHWC